MEEIKDKLAHSNEMSTETQKNIGRIKRNPNNIYRGAGNP